MYTNKFDAETENEGDYSKKMKHTPSLSNR